MESNQISGSGRVPDNKLPRREKDESTKFDVKDQVSVGEGDKGFNPLKWLRKAAELAGKLDFFYHGGVNDSACPRGNIKPEKTISYDACPAKKARPEKTISYNPCPVHKARPERKKINKSGC